jgi:hypothetical protein
MDEFSKFDNTAGFLVGNEVLTTGKTRHPQELQIRKVSTLPLV